MKLLEELQRIERDKALANGAWAATLEQLSALMRRRASGDYCGAVLIGVCSQQVETMLHTWAAEEGLEVKPGNGGWGLRALWLIWGHTPILSGNCDADVLPNGVLRLPKETTTKT